MSANPAPAAPAAGAADPAQRFEAIAGALARDPSVRWFLDEYARRIRSEDTRLILGAIAQLSDRVAAQMQQTQVELIRRELNEMSDAIAQTRRDIAAIRPPETHARVVVATEELDAIVTATERATTDILANAERLQERANDMRAQGFGKGIVDELEAIATNIFMACSFQDITGQRTSKVVNTLRYLEARVHALIEAWNADVTRPAGEIVPFEAADKPADPDRHLLNGPAAEGQGVSQDEIDALFG